MRRRSKWNKICNQYVGNWPGVTVEKKEGKLKNHDDVTITDLPGIYSLSPYTLEEVVARNYLLGENPDAVLNIIDGTNLERNLYLTTQVLELGIPTVVAINMMDIVEKNGDKIDIRKLAKDLSVPVVEISALKGTAVMDAAEAAIKVAKANMIPKAQTFSSDVEAALTKIEALALADIPEAQRRWYAVKLFERDDKVLASMGLSDDIQKSVEDVIAGVEAAEDDDAESIITNERYMKIGEVISDSYVKQNRGELSTSDKIDKVVTNRWLGLPIFVAVMFLVYYISVTTVGTWATDWANDGVFGDGCSTSERLPTTTPWTSTHRTSFSPMKSKQQRRARSTPVSPVPKMSSAPSKTVPSETSMKPSAAMETPWRKRASTWAMQSMKRSKQTVSRTRPTTASGSQASRSWSSSGSTD